MPNFIFEGLSIVSGPIKQMLVEASFGPLSASGPWRPSEWTGPALTMLTVPVSMPAVPSQDVDPVTGAALPGVPAYSGTQMYVFDAVLKESHARELKVTEHPIQASAGSPVTSISDHAYQRPAVVTLEVGMSDAMDSYQTGMWTSNPSKSISAYKTLVSLLEGRTLLTLTTRLDTYSNMVVQAIHPSDSAKTRWGLRATVVFRKVYFADVTAVSSSLLPTSGDDTGSAASARPQTTDSTAAGTVQPQAVPASITDQHAVPGGWSSGNISAL